MRVQQSNDSFLLRLLLRFSRRRLEAKRAAARSSSPCGRSDRSTTTRRRVDDIGEQQRLHLVMPQPLQGEQEEAFFPFFAAPRFHCRLSSPRAKGCMMHAGGARDVAPRNLTLIFMLYFARFGVYWFRCSVGDRCTRLADF
ncbi:hypothetical protein L596_022922 [Steinernema carpocapsae]|uniref:Uncharacterized protein n=1 Tax=Steinernema carpocapsae TaxID=34508 RepID=A0A4U5MBZ6_STECR|nr:hypothetical protein L596_022922 [Steinernema carpocapsae]